jgi:ABC-type multidrug transport system fused ATPase/permease subunit
MAMETLIAGFGDQNCNEQQEKSSKKTEIRSAIKWKQSIWHLLLTKLYLNEFYSFTSPLNVPLMVHNQTYKPKMLRALIYITLMGVDCRVFSQFYFVYWSNWLGQDIVKDIRIKLFKHILSFRMKYFDLFRTISYAIGIGYWVDCPHFSQGLYDY